MCGAAGTGLVLGFLGVSDLVRLIASVIVGAGLGFLVERVVYWDEKKKRPPQPPQPPPPAWPPSPPSGNGHP